MTSGRKYVFYKVHIFIIGAALLTKCTGDQIEKNLKGLDTKHVYRVLARKTEEREKVVDPGVDGRITLKWILKRWDRQLLDWSVSE
jgi:hypothetical protein